MIRRHASAEDGFTLPELLVAITILGIIMVAIGAMISTAFRTTTIVRAQLEGSRAPKLVSTYWVPDVEGAEKIELGVSGCGSGEPLVTFTWQTLASVAGADAANPPEMDDGTSRKATWARVTNGTRHQVVRTECGGAGPPRTATVVPSVANDRVEISKLSEQEYRITVSVPDTNEPTKEFTFSVDGAAAIPQVAAPVGP